jgi:hypothetical protein
VPQPKQFGPEGKWNMEKHVKALLSALRQSVNEAILSSHDVNAALAALSRAGRCPSLSVDVSLERPNADEFVSERHDPMEGSEPGELLFTGDDEDFLHSLGIATETAAKIPSEAI